jgi:hypothetical protein
MISIYTRERLLSTFLCCMLKEFGKFVIYVNPNTNCCLSLILSGGSTWSEILNFLFKKDKIMDYILS